MASAKEFPNFVAALDALGSERVKAIARAAKVEATNATELLARIKVAGDIAHFLEPADEDTMAPVLGVAPRGEWRAAISEEEIAKLPSYLRPSFRGDVWRLLQHRVRRPRSAVRADVSPMARVEVIRAWPELARPDAWERASKDDVTRALAKATGFTEDGAGRLVDRGVVYVVVAGGSYAMGLSAAEKKELNKRAKALGADAVEHAKHIAKSASPQHEVTLAPFLLATHLVADELGTPRLIDAEDAAELVRAAKRRFMSEAEWEWVARAAAGDTAWLPLATSPEAVTPLDVRDLAWGEWVDDGWHESYKGAPSNGGAWEAREEPEIARSGAGALSPWQNPGEELLLHVAARGRSAGAHGVRFALDLPPRG